MMQSAYDQGGGYYGSPGVQPMGFYQQQGHGHGGGMGNFEGHYGQPLDMGGAHQQGYSDVVAIYRLRSRQTCEQTEMNIAAAGRSVVVAEMFGRTPAEVRNIWARKLHTEETRPWWTEHELLLHACDKAKEKPKDEDKDKRSGGGPKRRARTVSPAARRSTSPVARHRPASPQARTPPAFNSGDPGSPGSPPGPRRGFALQQGALKALQSNFGPVLDVGVGPVEIGLDGQEVVREPSGGGRQGRWAGGSLDGAEFGLDGQEVVLQPGSNREGRWGAGGGMGMGGDGMGMGGGGMGMPQMGEGRQELQSAYEQGAAQPYGAQSDQHVKFQFQVHNPDGSPNSRPLAVPPTSQTQDPADGFQTGACDPSFGVMPNYGAVAGLGDASGWMMPNVGNLLLSDDPLLGPEESGGTDMGAFDAASFQWLSEGDPLMVGRMASNLSTNSNEGPAGRMASNHSTNSNEGRWEVFDGVGSAGGFEQRLMLPGSMD